MGIGWVQIDNNQVVQTFIVQIKTWSLSYKAELITILSAINTIPKNCNIQIFTNSQSVISKFNKTQQHTKNYNTKTKYNYWPIWKTLLNFIKSQNINITFYKVQAYSDNEFNNTADFLASHYSLLEFLEFKHTNYFNNSYILQ